MPMARDTGEEGLSRNTIVILLSLEKQGRGKVNVTVFIPVLHPGTAALHISCTLVYTESRHTHAHG